MTDTFQALDWMRFSSRRHDASYTSVQITLLDGVVSLADLKEGSEVSLQRTRPDWAWIGREIPLTKAL